MEYIDAAKLESKDLNKLLTEKLAQFGEVTIENPHSMHNIGAGISAKGNITIKGSTGFYTGGFQENTSILLDGNAGWYVGDNMMGGEIVVTKNTGSNAGVYIMGGTIVIRGGTGSRVGYGMKGGTIVVCGDTGMWAGQQTLGGRLILLGKPGKQVGESMYNGVIFVADENADLGGNVFMNDITDEEAASLNEIFQKYKINVNAGKLKAIRPSLTGRHTYTLFKPELTKIS